MAPNLDTYYLVLLGNPEEGNLAELEKKFKRASADYLVTRGADGVDISLIQKSGELTSAYLYLKAKWELRAKNEPFIPRILRMEQQKAAPLTKLEKFHGELYKIAVSGLFIAGLVGLYQFAVFAINNYIAANKKSFEQMVKEEEQIRAYGNHQAIQQKLENSNEFISKVGSRKLLPIHNSARGCNTSQLSYYIERGIDLNKVDKDGQTPLHWTSRINCVTGTKMLIKAGVRTDIKDKAGHTPLDWAKLSNNFESIQLLQKPSK